MRSNNYRFNDCQFFNLHARFIVIDLEFDYNNNTSTALFVFYLLSFATFQPPELSFIRESELDIMPDFACILSVPFSRME